jgi:hypothetical protein
MAYEPSVMAIRASSFGGLFDCAYRWEGTHLLGMRMPGSPRALIGTGIHGGTAAFDQARVDGKPIRLDDAAGIAIDTIAERIANEGVTWTSDEPDRREVERIALRLTTTYCHEISPRYEFSSVELTTKPLDIDCGGGVIVRLTGTMDRTRTIVGGLRPRVGDVKTGKKAVKADGVANTKLHRPQLGTYQLLAEHTLGERVDDTAEVIGLNTAGKYLTGTAQTTGAKDMLLGGDDFEGYIDMAARMFRTGTFAPNPQSVLCKKKYCARYYRCPYAAD